MTSPVTLSVANVASKSDIRPTQPTNTTSFTHSTHAFIVKPQMILQSRRHPLNLNLRGIVLLGSMGALLSSMMNMNGSGSGYVYAADEHLPASSSLLSSSLSAFFKKPSSSFLPPSSLVTPALSLSSYALYSFAVDKYANHILDKMKDVPIPIPDQSGRRTT